MSKLCRQTDVSEKKENQECTQPLTFFGCFYEVENITLNDEAFNNSKLQQHRQEELSTRLIQNHFIGYFIAMQFEKMWATSLTL